MVNTPQISSGTRARQSMARNVFTKEVESAVNDHVTVLHDIAGRYGRSQGYTRMLAGIGGYRKVKRGPTSGYGAFCGRKLKELNAGKEATDRITLPKFLKLHSGVVSAEYMTLSNDEKFQLLCDYLRSKGEERNVPKKASNVALTKAVYSKMQLVTSTCNDLNRQFGTESVVLFSRGEMDHSYRGCTYAMEGASQWLENADIGHTTPGVASTRMEGFVLSGCNSSITKALGCDVKVDPRKNRQDCRMMIQSGLENILKVKNHPRTNVNMNYRNYERKIVEQYGVELIGWPTLSPICNPGELSSNDVAILRNVLAKDRCKWRVLTQEEQEARVQSNTQRATDGESVYGPSRKQRARKVCPVDSEIQGDGPGIVDEDAA